MNIPDLIKNVLKNNNLSTREKIDNCLRIDSIQYTNLGIDSSSIEINLAKKNSRYIYDAIKTLDYDIGSMLTRAEDA